MNQVLKIALAVLGGIVIGASFASWGRQADGVEAEGDLTFSFVSGEKKSKNRLLQVEISGPILNDSLGGFSSLAGVTYGYEVQRILEKAGKDDRIKGVLLRLSTPGGTIVGSNAIFNALKDYRERTKKPVIAHIDGLSASGGVMSMVAANKIYAAPGSLIGSIGVIGGILTYYDNPVAFDGGLLGGGITTRNGIQQTMITAGRSKDLGNPFRKPTAEEIQVLRRGVKHEYDNFVRQVASSRGIQENTIRQQMGALIFDNQTARDYKLIDGTKTRQEAIADLANRAKVGENFQLVRVDRKGGLLSALFSAAPNFTYEQSQDMAQRDLCAVVNSHTAMVYYGDIRQLCPPQ